MARSRNLKPGLFKNEVLGVADPLYTLAFQGLWLLADRDGRLEDRPLRIKAEVFPYRDGFDMNAALDWLQKEGFILRYQVGGKNYIQVLNFVKHQNPHKNETDSDIPHPEEIGSNTEKIGTTPKNSEALGLIPSLLIPSLLIPEEKKPASPDASASLSQEPKKTLFDMGVSLLTNTGTPEGQARSFIAKYAKVDEAKLLEVLGGLAANPKAEPKSYIAAAMRDAADPVYRRLVEKHGKSLKRLPDGGFLASNGQRYNACGEGGLCL